MLRRCISYGMALTLMLALIMAACGQASSPESNQASSESETKKTLVVGYPSVTQTLDVDGLALWHHASTETVNNLYDPLFFYPFTTLPSGIRVPDFTAPVEGWLAESYEASADGKTWTIKLREGVVSQYGNELDADDVVWSYQRHFGVVSVAMFVANTIGLTDPGQIEKVDQYTVRFNLPEVNPLFINGLTLFWNAIYDSDEMKKHATGDDPWAQEWLSKNPAGFGPYRVESWTPGQEMVLVAREDYYRGQPAITQVIMREIPSSANRVAAIRAGDIDIAKKLTAQQRDELTDVAGIEIVPFYPGNQYVWLITNTRKPPLDDRRVRQAIAYAIPYGEIVNTIFYGLAEVMKTHIAATYPEVTDQYWQYDTDETKAKTLLDQSGTTGLQLTLTYPVDQPEIEQMAVQIQTALRGVGVELTLEKLAAAVFEERKQKGEFELALSNTDQPWFPDIAYATGLYFLTDATFNFTGSDIPDLDAAYAEAQTILDPELRRPYLLKIQELLAREMPYIPIVTIGEQPVFRDDVEGYAWYLPNAIRFDGLK